ncbi:hypothetical protein A1O1_03618 [Capronia coronata CBS 617.96]|uniref:RanBD1 domain-containing protein n=1 Tax=Capronia coronata CBS 617.96 TaxID=1182541 RepID=W9YLG5_9EURO|nr:uncharacterized protein A1O1_03618 [Capronia coronata CBS 617.96]EXJ90515.1 hypothetical protein A1O1_03618 [Capronia coronata CBS 617.96]
MSSDIGAERSVQDLEHSEDIHDQTPPEGSSDGEGGERTAREKLKKTSIAGLAQSSKSKSGEADTTTAHPLSESTNADALPEMHTEDGFRGRPSKKRSFEDLQTEDPAAGVENGGPPLPKKGLHKRMRSREISGDDPVQGLEKLEDIASPVQEESDTDAQKSPGGPGVLVAAPQKEEEDSAADDTNTKDTKVGSDHETDGSAVAAKDETSSTTKTTTTSEEPQSKPAVPPSSGFANFAAASPFSNFKPTQSPAKETATFSSTGKSTSTSAFASSGLSAFASSEKSPFGTVGSTAKSSGGFGGVSGGQSAFGSSSAGLGGASPFATKPVSGFGSAGGFGSASVFGSGGSGFGAPKPFGGGLSSFAGPAGAASSFGKAKPFGTANQDEEEGSEDGGDDEEKKEGDEDAQQDPRFKQQEVETGEEGEQTIYQCRAKLYHFDKEWKERGVGVFKVNIRYESKAIGDEADSNSDSEDSEDEAKEKEEGDVEAGGQSAFSPVERRARLIMRTDGVHRVVLNTPVFKDMNVGTSDGKEPSGKTMLFTGLEEGNPSLFQIKVGKEDAVKEIYYKIRELIDDL